jgi:hypothetical protein
VGRHTLLHIPSLHMEIFSNLPHFPGL